MTTFKAYKITAVLAALSLTTALGTAAMGASAQTTPVPTPDTVQTPPTQVPPVPTLPATEAAPSTPPAATAPQATAPEAKDFIREAFLANQFGIAASQIALTKAKTPETKAAAQTILDDGTKVRQDMVTAIQGATSDMHFDQTWDESYKAKLADLKSAKKGAAFDQAYIAVQGEVNAKTTSLFSSYASVGTDAAVKTFAANTLPVLQAEGDKLGAAGQGGN
jgi:putative membrane protein